MSIPTIFKQAKNYDLIQTTTYNAAIPSWFVSKILKKKCIITFHEYWGNLWKTLPFLKLYQRILYRIFEKSITKLHFTKFIAVSDYTKTSLINAGIPAEKIIRIYNGLDYEQIQKMAEKIIADLSQMA